MPLHHDCLKCHELIMENLSQETTKESSELLAHLEACPDCRSEFRQLKELSFVVEAEGKAEPTVPPEVWKTIEDAIEEHPQIQLSPVSTEGFSERTTLMAQYTYLVVLGMTLWSLLVFGQPLFISFLQSIGVSVDHWLFQEYAFMIFFLSIGGFVAILSAPILIEGRASPGTELGPFQRLLRSFSGKLRLLAC